MFTDATWSWLWIPPVGNSLVIVKAPIAPHKVNPVIKSVDA
jgi:hypothetical protein